MLVDEDSREENGNEAEHRSNDRSHARKEGRSACQQGNIAQGIERALCRERPDGSARRRQPEHADGKRRKQDGCTCGAPDQGHANLPNLRGSGLPRDYQQGVGKARSERQQKRGALSAV